jgi:hypothetical protein
MVLIRSAARTSNTGRPRASCRYSVTPPYTTLHKRSAPARTSEPKDAWSRVDAKQTRATAMSHAMLSFTTPRPIDAGPCAKEPIERHRLTPRNEPKAPLRCPCICPVPGARNEPGHTPRRGCPLHPWTGRIGRAPRGTRRSEPGNTRCPRPPRKKRRPPSRVGRPVTAGNNGIAPLRKPAGFRFVPWPRDFFSLAAADAFRRRCPARLRRAAAAG